MRSINPLKIGDRVKLTKKALYALKSSEKEGECRTGTYIVKEVFDAYIVRLDVPEFYSLYSGINVGWLEKDISHLFQEDV